LGKGTQVCTLKTSLIPGKRGGVGDWEKKRGKRARRRFLENCRSKSHAKGERSEKRRGPVVKKATTGESLCGPKKGREWERSCPWKKKKAAGAPRKGKGRIRLTPGKGQIKKKKKGSTSRGDREKRPRGLTPSVRSKEEKNKGRSFKRGESPFQKGSSSPLGAKNWKFQERKEVQPGQIKGDTKKKGLQTGETHR